MSIIGSNILAGAAGSGVSAYEIEQSLRFDGSTGKLTRTNPASSGITNAYKWSYSFWLKQSDVTNTGTIEQPLLSGGNTSGSGRTFCGWGYSSSGRFWLGNFTGADYRPDIRPADRVWRDPSAWEHFMLVYDTSESVNTDRIKIYSNGVRWNPTGGVGSTISSTQLFYAVNYASKASNIGYDNILNKYFDGYMAEVHFVDGQALDQYDFGEFDDNGVWRPIEYTGTYGLNGHYLKFDPSATNGVGHDHSGNGNNFTATGFTTSGTGTDVMNDTPTKNYPTLNPIATPSSFGYQYLFNGNLAQSMGPSLSNTPKGTFLLPSSGKWYWEVDVTGVGQFSHFGIGTPDGESYYYTYQNNGSSRTTGSVTASYGASYTTNDIIGVLYDADAKSIAFTKNGTSQGTAFTSISEDVLVPFFGQYYSASFSVNFGQFAFEQTVPTGYKALNTSNLPAPDIADGSDYFNTVLWTGNSTSARDITVADNSDNAWQPDFVWIKQRSSTEHHQLFDAIRGADARLVSSGTFTEDSSNTERLQAFNSDGFTVGDDIAVNSSSQTYVAWNWLAGGSTSSNTDGTATNTVTVSASPTAGFSIVTYSGQSTNFTWGHGLGVPPSMVIIKGRTNTAGWSVYHSALGATKRLALNTTDAAETMSYFQNTEPTSTVFSVTTNGGTGANGVDYVAYCFAEVEGYSKFGSYTGNGNSTDGPFVYCGFRPAWWMIKRTDTNGDWYILDTTRSTYNVSQAGLRANSTSVETTYTNAVDLLSNGFKIRRSGADINASGSTHIFVAFAENPFGGDGVSPATAR